MEQKLKELRELCLKSVYGRYDLIAEIVPHGLLMNKPRIVMRHLCRILEIESSQLSYNALTKWLKKYRDLHLSKETRASGNLAENGNNEEENIFDFQPTDPFANPKTEPPLIKIL